ncbi:hypothetical protein [Micromonospora lupini]|uniref:hypothetical protein n=1 Tax=Micromonospora lupini TaxID=285679 RepID=UPI003618D0E3
MNDDRLLLWMAEEAAVTVKTVQVPDEPGRIAVVSAAEVTRREDFFELVAERLMEHFGGLAGGVRLVALGGYPTGLDPVRRARWLADHIGLEVVLPVAGPLPAVDAPCDPQGQPLGTPADWTSFPGWIAVAPRRPVRQDWFWPVTTRVDGARQRPRSSARRLLSVPDLSGVRPQPRLLRHGGVALAPLRPLPRRRLSVPVPQRVPPANPVVRESGELPGRRTAAGWSFLDGGTPPAGVVKSLAGALIEVSVGSTGFRLDGRALTARALATMIDVAVPRSVTPATLALRGAPLPASAMQLIVGALVDALATPLVTVAGPLRLGATGVLTAAQGFQRWYPRTDKAVATRRVEPLGQVLPPRPRRATIAAPLRRPRPAERPADTAAGTAGPVTHATLGASPQMATSPFTAAPIPDEMIARLSPVRVTVPTGAVRKALDELDLNAAGAGEPSESTDISPGPMDVAGAGVGVPDATALSEPGSVDPASPTGSTVDDTEPSAPEGRPLGGTSPENASRSGPEPVWVVPATGVVPHRAALRTALAKRFDAHARVVSRALAESPGLRAAGDDPADLVTGFVVVRAYASEERDAINPVLRGEGDMDDARALLLSRCAARGLRRLPAVLGPVHAVAVHDPTLILGYQPGTEVREPAFVDVALTEPAGPLDAVRYTIWSMSARRLGPLGIRGAETAVFAPGARFTVLAVELTATAEEPPRVYLRELPADSTSGVTRRRGATQTDAQVLTRLRAAVAGGTPSAGAVHDEAVGAVRLAFAPGLSADGRPYRLPSDPARGEAESRSNPEGQA